MKPNPTSEAYVPSSREKPPMKTASATPSTFPTASNALPTTASLRFMDAEGGSWMFTFTNP